MRRTYSRERYLQLVADMRAAIPDLALTTDLIVGFPGETEADFEETISAVEEVGYDSAFTFVFSPRAGTEAAEPRPGLRGAQARADRAPDRGRPAVARPRGTRERVGRVEEVLVEGAEPDRSGAAARPHAPQHDGQLRRRGGRPASSFPSRSPAPPRRRSAVPSSSPQQPEPVVARIFGPTASGKSAVAEAIAGRIPADLISRRLGAALPRPADPDQPVAGGSSSAVWELDHEASVAEYQELAHAAIDAALAAGRTPVVVGGTGLYFRAALGELDVPPAPAPGARERWARALRRAGGRGAPTPYSPSATPRRPRPSTRTTAAASCARSSSPRPATRLRGDRLWADDDAALRP